MKPRFRADGYAGGLSAAIEQMSLLIHGEKLPAPRSQARKSAPSWADHLDFLLPLLFFGFRSGLPSPAPSLAACWVRCSLAALPGWPLM
jgi:uncharacterized protein